MAEPEVIDLEVEELPLPKRPRVGTGRVLPRLALGGLRSIRAYGDDDAATESEAPFRAIVRAHAAGGGAAWCDPEFTATALSICGKADKEKDDAPANDAPPPPLRAAGEPPPCRCRAPCQKTAVKLDTPNKGRAYFCCAKRNCGFFAWADGGPVATRGRMSNLEWARFPDLHVVSDFGFRAQDLRQGGVGDWCGAGASPRERTATGWPSLRARR